MVDEEDERQLKPRKKELKPKHTLYLAANVIETINRTQPTNKGVPFGSLFGNEIDQKLFSVYLLIQQNLSGNFGTSNPLICLL